VVGEGFHLVGLHRGIEDAHVELNQGSEPQGGGKKGGVGGGGGWGSASRVAALHIIKISQFMYLPLLARPQRPLGMVLVLAAGVGVNQESELSGELVAILLGHEGHHELIVVHGNEHAPFSCVSRERTLKGKGDSRRRVLACRKRATVQSFVERMVSDHAKAAIVVAPVAVRTEHGSAGGVGESRTSCRGGARAVT
jgi:hypothetical protein